MVSYAVKYDGEAKLLHCLVNTSFSDGDLPDLLAELRVATTLARSDGSMRVLWDNRPGKIMTPDVAEAIRGILLKNAPQGERVAILMPDSKAKARGRPQMSANVEMFLSENAAHTWLRIGVG